MQMLNSTIHRLYEKGFIKLCDPTQFINSYTYEFMGRITTQRITVDPRMKKVDLIRIVDAACNGSMENMVTLAMLYNVGYGVPFDARLADAWAHHATLVKAAVGFEACCKAAKDHAFDNPPEIYPNSIVFPCLAIVDQIHDHKHDGTLRQGTYVMPRLDGIRVYLIYRHYPGTVPHLYAGFYRDGEDTFIALDKLIELGAPRYFGELRNRIVITEYTPFGDNTMYVVAGTIYVPESKGGSALTVDTFHEFLANNHAPLARERFDTAGDVAELEELEKTVNRLKRIQQRFTDLTKPIPAEQKAELRAAETRYADLANSLKVADPQAEYEAYVASLPKSRLRFVMHELYRWNRDGLKTVKMSRIMQTHLQSLGFTSLMHAALETVGWVADHEDVPKTVKMFEKTLDAKVNALIIQPSTDATVRFVDVTRIDV
jgi:hypothetical protein